ncbi:vam6/Vps39-like protein [Quillaja saponaria]|uniref:Vam6/Vps39-like protein n=1 Tax=Quillaja saponaria TaxID=32244 RepID=A0AAD7KQR9_QUISA|nr:vam6/Vps39-like protein [Quillaja saponaria]
MPTIFLIMGAMRKPWNIFGNLKGSSGISDDMEPSPPHLSETDEGSTLESNKMSHNTLMALIKFCKRRDIVLLRRPLLRCNSMHREALELHRKFVEESNSNQSQTGIAQRFKPESIIEYLKPICGTDPMLVLEFSMLVLESCPAQTIDLFLSGNIPADLVNSYLKQHAPSMQGRYLELMLAMDENGISGNLQNEMVQIYVSKVLDWHADLRYNPEALLKCLPADALYEERAILLGKINQHELALSLYVHKLHVPELALSYCDRVYETAIHQPTVKSTGNIYFTLLQIYLNPRRTSKNFERRITNPLSPSSMAIPKAGTVMSVKTKGGRGTKKIATIEGAEDMRVSLSSTDSSKSDGDADESIEEGGATIMLDEVLDMLSSRIYFHFLDPFCGNLVKHTGTFL